jgi:hypothetical protein
VKSETLNRRKVLLGSQPLLNASGFDNSTVLKTRGRVLYSRIPKVTKHDTTVEEDVAKYFGVSAFWVSVG